MTQNYYDVIIVGGGVFPERLFFMNWAAIRISKKSVCWRSMNLWLPSTQADRQTHKPYIVVT